MPRHFIPVLFRGDRVYGVVRGGLDVERSGFALSAILANSRGARGFRLSTTMGRFPGPPRFTPYRWLFRGAYFTREAQ